MFVTTFFCCIRCIFSSFLRVLRQNLLLLQCLKGQSAKYDWYLYSLFVLRQNLLLLQFLKSQLTEDTWSMYSLLVLRQNLLLLQSLKGQSVDNSLSLLFGRLGYFVKNLGQNLKKRVGTTCIENIAQKSFSTYLTLPTRSTWQPPFRSVLSLIILEIKNKKFFPDPLNDVRIWKVLM